MLCPVCSGAIVDQTPVGAVIICNNCLASVNGLTGEHATSADTLVLSPEEITALKTRRKGFRKALIPA